MEKYPFLSIVTVTRNSEKTISKTLESLLNQSFQDFEHIIIDGNSSDKTLDIIKNYKNKYYNKKIRIISEPDEGIYDALNKGIRNAQGKIIGVLHSDDVYYNNNILQEVNELFNEDKSIEILSGDCIYISDDENKVVRFYSSKNFKSWMFRFGFMPAHTATFISKKVYLNSNLYDKKYKSAGDFDFFVKILNVKKINFKIINKIIVKMKVGGTSTSGIKSYIRTSNEINSILKENKIYSNIIFVYLRLPIKFVRNLIYKMFTI